MKLIPHAVAVASATALIAVPAAQAAFPGRNGAIAIKRYESGNPKGTAVLAVRSNGVLAARLGDGTSPPGRRRAAGSRSRPAACWSPSRAGPACGRSSPTATSPSWAPNGKTLVFTRDLEADESAGFPTLFRVNTDGDRPQAARPGPQPDVVAEGRADRVLLGGLAVADPVERHAPRAHRARSGASSSTSTGRRTRARCSSCARSRARGRVRDRPREQRRQAARERCCGRRGSAARPTPPTAARSCTRAGHPRTRRASACTGARSRGEAHGGRPG